MRSRAPILVVLVLSTGCGTIDSFPRIYGGTRQDVDAITFTHHGGGGDVGALGPALDIIVWPFAVVDLPFSFVLDTLAFPVTGIIEYMQPRGHTYVSPPDPPSPPPVRPEPPPPPPPPRREPPPRLEPEPFPVDPTPDEPGDETNGFEELDRGMVFHFEGPDGTRWRHEVIVRTLTAIDVAITRPPPPVPGEPPIESAHADVARYRLAPGARKRNPGRSLLAGKTPVARETITVSGIAFDCDVIDEGGVRSWIAPRYPFQVKVVGGGEDRVLVAVERGAR